MGTLWPRSGTVELAGSTPRKAANAKAYFYQGNSTTMITVYTTAAENVAHPNPVVADANGRWPNVWVPYRATYDVKVTTAGGTQLSYAQNIANAQPYTP